MQKSLTLLQNIQKRTPSISFQFLSDAHYTRLEMWKTVNYNFFKAHLSHLLILNEKRLILLLETMSFSFFKTNSLKFVRPNLNSIDCHNPKRLNLITKVRLDLSHLQEHKFKPSFQDRINVLLHSLKFVNEKLKLNRIKLSRIGKIDHKMCPLEIHHLIKMEAILLKLLMLSTKRRDKPLFWNSDKLYPLTKKIIKFANNQHICIYLWRCL